MEKNGGPGRKMDGVGVRAGTKGEGSSIRDCTNTSAMAAEVWSFSSSGSFDLPNSRRALRPTDPQLGSGLNHEIQLRLAVILGLQG
jgi:hypothetical protein